MRTFIGVNIRRFRHEAGMSSDQLAAEAGLSAVRAIEITGTGRIANIERIAAVLATHLGRNVTLQDLVAEPPPGVLGEISAEMERSSGLIAKARRRAGRLRAASRRHRKAI